VSEQIKVSVRKGADGERLLSFPRPERIPTSELLERGVAVEGDQAVFSVSGAWDPDEQRRVYTYPRFDLSVLPRFGQADSLPEALAATEEGLVTFFKGYDYEVEFV
jgi:hypothetical protein